MAKKKRKIRARTKADRIYPDEWHEEQERSLRMLAERIAYYEARIAARERGDNPDAANAA